MAKYAVTYEIGAKDDLDTICKRFVSAADADLAVNQVLNEKDANGYPLSATIMLRVTKVERWR